MDPTITKEIVERMQELPVAQQRMVLEMVKSLTGPPPKGTPAHELLACAGVISAEDARQMTQAIEEGCERVDANAW